MSSLFLYCILLWSIVGIFGSPTNSLKDQGRALYQFGRMISHITDRNPLDYNGYGCHCGLGSKGSKVVDATDQCCVAHDYCYNSAWYDYDFVTNDILCTDELGTVDRAACECDRQAALCFRSSPYNPAYKDYPANQC
ncbi:unnamed protein product [Rotaria sp. Silwood1]|nr:unnamed protein product [Rotaria sp. Silwood1]